MAKAGLDVDGSESVLSGPPGSEQIEDVFKDVMREFDFEFVETIFDGRSDYAGFIEVGIPAGGLFSGAEQVMSSFYADRFGGIEGESYDACYHLLCDDIDNINEEGFLSMVSISLEVLLRLSNSSEPSTARRFWKQESLPMPIVEHSSGCTHTKR